MLHCVFGTWLWNDIQIGVLLMHGGQRYPAMAMDLGSGSYLDHIMDRSLDLDLVRRNRHSEVLALPIVIYWKTASRDIGRYGRSGQIGWG